MRKIEISQCKKYGKGVGYYWQNYGNGIGHTIKTIANKQFHRQFKLGILYRENTTPGSRKSTTRIFMHEGGYGIFGPAMLVYRENTTPVIRQNTANIFIPEGGYGAFGPAMLVYIAGQCDLLSAFVIIGLRKDKRWPVLAKLNQNLQKD